MATNKKPGLRPKPKNPFPGATKLPNKGPKKSAIGVGAKKSKKNPFGLGTGTIKYL